MPSAQARDVILDAILDQEQADRVVLSLPNLFSAPQGAIRAGRLYPHAGEKLAQLRALFPDDQLEVFMAVKNPATFIPALFDQSGAVNLDVHLNGVAPADLRWSEMATRMRAAVTDVPLTFWCNEDTPLIWASIIREMAGLDHGEKIVGGFDLLGTIMSREGMKRFRAYLKDHPVMTEMQKRRVMSAFLDKFALDEEIEEELDLPGWTDALVEQMTGLYDEDMLAIQRIPGTQVIAL